MSITKVNADVLDLTDGYAFTGTVTGASNTKILSTTTITGDPASVDVTLTAGYTRYELEVFNLAPGTDNIAWYVRLSNDGGSTFEADSGDYAYQGLRYADDWNNISSSATFISVHASAGGAAGEIMNGTITITGALNASTMTIVHASLDGDNTGAVPTMFDTIGRYKTAEACNAVQILPSSGTISGGIVTLRGFV